MCESEIEIFGSMDVKSQIEIIGSYKKLIEQNADLHKEIARLKNEMPQER